MPTAPSAFDPHTLSQLQGLELRARYLVDGYLAGRHRARQHGQSVEFTEHREYFPGDDLRYVDWKVFGKTDKVYLKRFEAETDLSCHLLVDISDSMSYHSAAAPLSKFAYAQCLAASLGAIVLRQRDRAGLVTFDEDICQQVPASSRPAHLQHILEALETGCGKRGSQIGQVLHQLSQQLKRRSLVVLLSDLLGDTESVLSGLKHLRYQRHELLVLQVLDPAELDFAFPRTTLFQGLEAQPHVLAEPRALRRAYLAVLHEYLARLQTGCQSLQVEYEVLRTDEPFDVALSRVLGERR